MDEAICGEVLGQRESNDTFPTLEQVNSNALRRLNNLLLKTEEPELILALTKSLATLNASLRNNDIFAPQESEEERREKEKAKIGVED